MSSSSTVLAALTGKFAVGAATASIIVAGGTAAAAAAGSGSLSPTNWGQYISQTVVPDCKAAASAAGLHGIGSCVSSIARLHGQEVASAARQHGAGADAAHGHSAQAPGHEEASEGRLNGAENGRAPSQPGEGSNNQGHPSGAGAAGDHGAPPKR